MDLAKAPRRGSVLLGQRVVPVLAGVLALAGCGSGSAGRHEASTSSNSSGSAGTVVIGMSSSLSGAYGLYGKPMEIGAKLAIANVNSSGGVKVGGTIYQLKLDTVDDRSDPPTAVSAVTGLVRDKGVKVVAGPIGNLAPGVVQLTARANVINLNAAGVAAGEAGTPQFPLLFATLVSNRQRVAQAVAAIQRLLPGAKSVAVVGPSDTTGQATLPLLAPALRAAGFTVKTFVYPADTTDLTTTMSNVASMHPDVIFEGWAVNNLQALGPALSSAGISKTTTVLGWGTSYGNASLVGGRPFIADPVVEADFTTPRPTTAGAAFRAKYLDFTKTSSMPSNAVSAEWFYDAIRLLAAAMEKAGTVTNTAAIAKAMNTVSVTGISGEKVTFRRNVIQNGTDFTLVGNGKSRTVHIPVQ